MKKKAKILILIYILIKLDNTVSLMSHLMMRDYSYRIDGQFKKCQISAFSVDFLKDSQVYIQIGAICHWTQSVSAVVVKNTQNNNKIWKSIFIK